MLGGALCIKSVRQLSRLAIDADKAWPTPWVDTHAITWALTAWNYRKKITITGSTVGAQADYQIRFKIINDRGIDIPGSNTIHTGGVCEIDFRDLRFTNAAGTLLPYYIEPSYGYSSNNYCYVWVKVDAIPASPTTVDIYVYFGNMGAAIYSNGTNTFAAFDNFDDGNLVGWTERDPVACNWSAIAAAAKDGAAGCQGQMAAAGNGGILTWDASTFQSCRIEMWVRLPDADTLADCEGGIVYAWTDNTHFYRICLSDVGATERISVFEVNTSRAYSNYTIAAATWYKIQALCFFDGANIQFWIYVNDVYYTGYTDTTPEPTPGSVGIWNSNTNASRVYGDTFFVTKFVNPEPAISAIGSTEKYRTAYGISDIQEVSAGMTKGDLPVSNGTTIDKIAPGSIGTELTAQGPGNPLVYSYPP